jgi:hypothetical protein
MKVAQLVTFSGPHDPRGEFTAHLYQAEKRRLTRG